MWGKHKFGIRFVLQIFEFDTCELLNVIDSFRDHFSGFKVCVSKEVDTFNNLSFRRSRTSF